MQPKFFFLFSLNNSGTTVMCQYLAGQANAYLSPFGSNEGQMAPAVKDMMRADPWNPASAFDWRFIRSEWEKLAIDAGHDIFIEGSPPNMVRVADIMDVFGDDMHACFSISNPYMHISSSLKNYWKSDINEAAILHYTERWAGLATRQMHNIEQFGAKFPMVTYEAFCDEPGLLNAAFGLEGRKPLLITGKGNSGIRRIANLSTKNIAFLSIFEIEIITEFLRKHKKLMRYFGYSVLTLDTVNMRFRNELAMAMAGQMDRVRWENERSQRLL